MSSHGGAEDEIVYSQSKSFYPLPTVGSQQTIFTQEVTFSMAKMVFSSLYHKFPSKKGVISWIYNSLCDKFCGIEWNICFLLIYTNAFLLSSRVLSSTLQPPHQFARDENDLNSSQVCEVNGL